MLRSAFYNDRSSCGERMDRRLARQETETCQDGAREVQGTVPWTGPQFHELDLSEDADRFAKLFPLVTLKQALKLNTFLELWKSLVVYGEGVFKSLINLMLYLQEKAWK